ncbi:hypothetical protein BH09PSE6_BH09PSE6_19880 [soil metagenome]
MIDQASTGFARQLFDNLANGLASASFRAGSAARWHGTSAQLLVLCLVVMGLGELVVLARVGIYHGRFYASAVPQVAFPALCLLLGAWLITSPRRTAEQFLTACVVVLSTLAWPGALMVAVLTVLRKLHWEQDLRWLAWLVAAWLGVACALALVRILTGRSAGHRLVLLAVVLALAAASPHYFSRHAHLWDVDDGDPDSDESLAAAATREAELDRSMSEAALYAQPALLDRALADLKPQRPGIVDLYALEFAPVDHQDVFVSEVGKIDRLLADRFDTAGRSVVLGSHASTAQALPFATLTSMRRALQAIAQRMDVQEDVLLLYITTHGSKDHVLSVGLGDYRFEAIDVAALKNALDESGIVNRLVVVSACYSGGFVPALASPTSGVIAAARPDRPSFGCTNGEDWTYFGRAYFNDALTATHDFEKAFEIALPLIAEREAAAKEQPSEPQMQIGAELHERLRLLTARLEANRSSVR